ncbi:MAG: hypothetical protein DMG30_07775 [Acidobacteria bacterium]|nr:MAG: hypothetical protein DMG30_07775 [Acidobacteriota bacterium]
MDALQYLQGARETCMVDNTHVVVLKGTGRDMVPVPKRSSPTATDSASKLMRKETPIARLASREASSGAWRFFSVPKSAAGQPVVR